MTTYLVILLLAVVGSFVQRVSGFGFGIFVMMFLPYVLPSFGECITLSGLLAGTTSLVVVLRHLRSVRWKEMTVIFVANIILSFFTIKYMAGLGNATLKSILGVMLVGVGLYSLFLQGRHRLTARSWGVQAGVGALSGIMGGAFAIPGPPVVLYSIGFFEDKREYIATLQAFFFLSNVFYALFRAQAGFFTEHTLFYWLLGLAGLAVGMWLGALCFERISGRMLKKVVYVMMIVSGVAAML